MFESNVDTIEEVCADASNVSISEDTEFELDVLDKSSSFWLDWLLLVTGSLRIEIISGKFDDVFDPNV